MENKGIRHWHRYGEYQKRIEAQNEKQNKYGKKQGPVNSQLTGQEQRAAVYTREHIQHNFDAAEQEND
ncbi:hypothetical protein NBRC13296_16140 [Paenibacillus chitinolyticus]|uniref:hypothetical protein n=1 Tax=Paenibacillus chitinolyticus TaxID=79263 RepID=UPI0035570808